VVCIAALSIAGCGDGTKTYNVTGTVKFTDGSPLTTGTVIFAGENVASQGEIQPDGSYALGTNAADDGAPAGSYKVFLAGPIFEAEGDAAPEEDAGEDTGAGQVETEDGETEEYDATYSEGMEEDGGEALVNQKFSAADTSGLTCEVTGSTTFDITVEKP